MSGVPWSPGRFISFFGNTSDAGRAWLAIGDLQRPLIKIRACRRYWRRPWKKRSPCLRMSRIIASQILASLADEDAWKKRIAEKRDVIRRMAREALEEDERGETLPLDDLL